MTSYGLLIFDGADELDFTGPWEVFAVSIDTAQPRRHRVADRRGH